MRHFDNVIMLKVWAYGLTLMELADLGYPYPGAPFKRMMVRKATERVLKTY